MKQCESNWMGNQIYHVLAVALIACLMFQGSGGRAVGETRDYDQKEAIQSISEPDKPVVKPRLLQKAANASVQIYVSLDKQRAYLFVNNEIAIDTPISSGKRKGMTPHGEFAILEKNQDYRPTFEGNFVDRSGRVIRRGVSSETDSAPSGTTFVRAPVKYFMRLSRAGLGIQAGTLPGYRATSGSIWMPEETARLFFENTKIGTLVVVGN